ncbi:MAG: thioredoxin family protein [Anaerolineaceae bacterium]|nr:thioredoxin family protein [Anaerolineaceae bacterium]|tara:strand:+ start:40 stop:291 length:252 start_codon:yes stop_codon:yes gene_type:complete
MLTIKILGSGCPNCKRLEREVNDALSGQAVDFEVIKVTDYADIMTYGIMSTPGLVMNETVLSTGRIPKRQQIIDWALQYQTAE